MFQRILLALDSGDTGAVATSLTVALALKCGAAVQVVHVDRTLAGGHGPRWETPAQAADVVAEALREMQEAGVSASGVTYRTTRFDLPFAISDLAEQCRADVIVVGSRRRRHLPPLFRRGMRERIARHTSLPIVTAPAPLRVAERGPTFAGLSPTIPRPVRSPSGWSNKP